MADPVRRLQQLRMLILAADDALNSSTTWGELVELACQYGRSLNPPLTRKELYALERMKANALFLVVAQAERAVLRG